MRFKDVYKFGITNTQHANTARTQKTQRSKSKYIIKL